MIVYFRVDDVDEKAKSVIEAGCAIIEGPFDVPNRFASDYFMVYYLFDLMR